MPENYDWEMQMLKARLEKLEGLVEKKHITIYGNGQEGLTSRMKGLETKVENIEEWKEGWEKVTNYDDFKNIRSNLEDITKKIYMTGAALAIIMGVLKIVPPDVVNMIFK